MYPLLRLQEDEKQKLTLDKALIKISLQTAFSIT